MAAVVEMRVPAHSFTAACGLQPHQDYKATSVSKLILHNCKWVSVKKHTEIIQGTTFPPRRIQTKNKQGRNSVLSFALWISGNGFSGQQTDCQTCEEGAQELSLLPGFAFMFLLLQKSPLPRERQCLAIAGVLSVGALVLQAFALLQVHTSSLG